VLHPVEAGDWIRVATLVVLGIIGGLFAAAVAAARRPNASASSKGDAA